MDTRCHTDDPLGHQSSIGRLVGASDAMLSVSLLPARPRVRTTMCSSLPACLLSRPGGHVLSVWMWHGDWKLDADGNCADGQHGARDSLSGGSTRLGILRWLLWGWKSWVRDLGVMFV